LIFFITRLTLFKTKLLAPGRFDLFPRCLITKHETHEKIMTTINTAIFLPAQERQKDNINIIPAKVITDLGLAEIQAFKLTSIAGLNVTSNSEQ